MTFKTFIHAPNIHQGGGRSLLLALVKALDGHGPGDVVLTVDSRMVLPQLAKNVLIRTFKPTLIGRLLAECFLKQEVNVGDQVLCFGNLPPLFLLNGHVTVFVQNRYLVDSVRLNGFPIKTRLRLLAERLWLKARLKTADEVVVQSPSMKRQLCFQNVSAHVIPFMGVHLAYVRSVPSNFVKKKFDFDFLYVASGEPHKNHVNLINAWSLLAREGIFPSLKITIDRSVFPELCNWIGRMCIENGLQIENMGEMGYSSILDLYASARALVYPSKFESLGLPLIEARQAGLPIIASELDFVRDAIDPEQTFDPNSSLSIARAIKRFLELQEEPLPLTDANSFLKQTIKKTN